MDTDYFFVQKDTVPSLDVTLSGTILNARTNQPIPAELDLYFDTDIVKADVQVVHDGKYIEVLSKTGWYLIDVSAPGFLGVTDTLWLLNDERKSIRKDYYLTPIEVGLNVVIPSIHFHFGQTTLTEESFPQLDKVVRLFKKNQNIAFEIAGYTDDEGPEDYNLFLSQGRAQAVVDYLIGQGIDPSLLIAKGYGETKPIDTTNTKAGKAKNRRVEFTVVRKPEND
jgi:outer membrane protein OmpA-like peptidoglycan-associated protein